MVTIYFYTLMKSSLTEICPSIFLGVMLPMEVMVEMAEVAVLVHDFAREVMGVTVATEHPEVTVEILVASLLNANNAPT